VLLLVGVVDGVCVLLAVSEDVLVLVRVFGGV
jgi:hypothetical protein